MKGAVHASPDVEAWGGPDVSGRLEQAGRVMATLHHFGHQGGQNSWPQPQSGGRGGRSVAGSAPRPVMLHFPPELTPLPTPEPRSLL